MTAFDNQLILIVDSDPKFLDILLNLVRIGGFNVEGKTNWTEGISFTKKNSIFLAMTQICFLKPLEFKLFKTIQDVSPKTIRCVYSDTQCVYSDLGKCSHPKAKSWTNSLLKDGEIHEYFEKWDVDHILDRIRYWFGIYNKS